MIFVLCLEFFIRAVCILSDVLIKTDIPFYADMDLLFLWNGFNLLGHTSHHTELQWYVVSFVLKYVKNIVYLLKILFSVIRMIAADACYMLLYFGC